MRARRIGCDEWKWFAMFVAMMVEWWTGDAINKKRRTNDVGRESTGYRCSSEEYESLTRVQWGTVGRHGIDRSHTTREQIGNTDCAQQPAWEPVSQCGRSILATMFQCLAKFVSHITNNVICNISNTFTRISSLLTTISEQHVTRSSSSNRKQSHIKSDASDPWKRSENVGKSWSHTTHFRPMALANRVHSYLSLTESIQLNDDGTMCVLSHFTWRMDSIRMI